MRKPKPECAFVMGAWVVLTPTVPGLAAGVSMGTGLAGGCEARARSLY